MTGPITGCLRKMKVSIEPQTDTDGPSPVQYELVIGDRTVPMNPLIGQCVTLTHCGSIVCINCQRITPKSFSQGYCYNCFRTLAECDQCIMSPEKCHYHLGTCRDPEWGDQYCMQPHYVYLANSSGLKVGITRGNQLPTRWIDQGALRGRVIALVHSRRVSGLVEATLRQFISDRTSWQAMLKGKVKDIDLDAEWEALYPQVKDSIDAIRDEHGPDSVKLVDAPQLKHISFPVVAHPEKVKSLNLDKTPTVSGVLQGIKGQYLILDTGVINIRKYTGYEVEFSATEADSS